jgi:DNA (cytosine-5)-methyltransferase 1
MPRQIVYFSIHFDSGAPLPASSPSLVSLFTGAGGLDIGLEQAGFCTVAAVECDDDCVQTLHANQKAMHPLSGDECLLSQAKIVAKGIESAGRDDLVPPHAKRDWVPDLLAGGPPCQPFSSSGKMLSVDDPRGRLFEHFVRLAGELKPRLILFENVRGLVTARGPNGEPGEVVLMIKEAFESLGYATSFRLLNAADYGCPQRRVRLFMLASRVGAPPEFPEATHGLNAGKTLFGSKLPWVTLGQFLQEHPPIQEEELVRPSPVLAGQLADLPEGRGLKSAGARETTRPGGHWGYRQGTFIADRTLPARTVTASASQDWLRLPDGSLRRLAMRECASLQGFPHEWVFQGSIASRFRQIGNAVPAIFGRVLGISCREALRRKCQSPGLSVPLPPDFEQAVAYTRKEHKRNGASRRRVLELQRKGSTDLRGLKGLGVTGGD